MGSRKQAIGWTWFAEHSLMSLGVEQPKLPCPRSIWGIICKGKVTAQIFLSHWIAMNGSGKWLVHNQDKDEPIEKYLENYERMMESQWAIRVIEAIRGYYSCICLNPFICFLILPLFKVKSVLSVWAGTIGLPPLPLREVFTFPRPGQSEYPTPLAIIIM